MHVLESNILSPCCPLFRQTTTTAKRKLLTSSENTDNRKTKTCQPKADKTQKPKEEQRRKIEVACENAQESKANPVSAGDEPLELPVQTTEVGAETETGTEIAAKVPEKVEKSSKTDAKIAAKSEKSGKNSKADVASAAMLFAKPQPRKKASSKSRQKRPLPKLSPEKKDQAKSGPKDVFDISLNVSIPVPSSLSYGQFKQQQEAQKIRVQTAGCNDVAAEKAVDDVSKRSAGVGAGVSDGIAGASTG